MEIQLQGVLPENVISISAKGRPRCLRVAQHLYIFTSSPRSRLRRKHWRFIMDDDRGSRGNSFWGPRGLDKGTAVCLLIFEIFFPGIATMALGCVMGCNCSYICIGLCQILTIPLFGFGIVWAWIWGIVAVLNASDRGKHDAGAPQQHAHGPPPAPQAHAQPMPPPPAYPYQPPPPYAHQAPPGYPQK